MKNQEKIYWLNQAKKLKWSNFPKKIFSSDKSNHPRWYEDGKIDIYYNLIERNLKKKTGVYIISENKKIKFHSLNEIDKYVNNFCYYLEKNYNLEKQTKIMIYASSSIESVIMMLSCSKLGIHFSVIFEDLSPVAIKQRIDIFQPNIFLTRKKEVLKIFNSKFKKKNKLKTFYFKNFFAMKMYNKKFKSKIVNSTSNFFSLFTSGTTGEPKGVTHSYGGYLVYANLTCRKNFGIREKMNVFTASDAGWINGHTYALFGPLSLGANIFLIEKPIKLLDENFLKKILNFNVNVLYLPVTLIRLMKTMFSEKILNKNKLKTLGSMGEPLAPEVGKWYSKKFNLKNKSIINTYFQTETGGIICTPKYNSNPKKTPHGSVGVPVNKYIKIIKLNKKIKREFKVSSPWPGCMADVLNGKKVWKKYWDIKNNFRLFDLATKNKGNIFIHGRNDDVINIRGHRIGSAEIESNLLKLKNVSEACAISVQDKLEGGSIILFIVSNSKNEKKINDNVINYFGTFAIPKRIFFVNQLPKTRSGKIVRRLLRMIYINPNKKNYGDLSTLGNPKIIQNLRKEINEQ
tara:strand:+ start:619 stop:2334 length:1716 start_codon:yes stop_codon:yes gene_type:complete